MGKILVISKRVGEPPRYVYISDSLENLQKYVGGYIEIYRPIPGINCLVLCNEEAKLMGSAYNCIVGTQQLFGDILFVSERDGEFTDLEMNWSEFSHTFHELFEAWRA